MDLDFFAIDEQRVERFRDVGFDPATSPIVFCRDRTSDAAKLTRERRPQHDRVEVAGMVCKVDTLARIWLAIDPPYGKAAEELREEDDGMAG